MQYIIIVIFVFLSMVYDNATRRFIKGAYKNDWTIERIKQGCGFMNNGREPGNRTIYNIVDNNSKKTKHGGGPVKYFTKTLRKRLGNLLKSTTTSNKYTGVEVTSDLLIREGKFSCSRYILNREVRSLGYKWLSPKRSLDLSPADRAERLEFSRKFKSYSPSQLKSYFGLILDEKCFNFRSNHRGRLHEQNRRVRGIYVKPGQRF